MSQFQAMNEMFKLLAPAMREPQPDEVCTNDSKRQEADPCHGDGQGCPTFLGANHA